MQLELTEEEVQTVINGLAELPARISYNLLGKISMQRQAHFKRQADEQARSRANVAAVPRAPTVEDEVDAAERDRHYP